MAVTHPKVGNRVVPPSRAARPRRALISDATFVERVKQLSTSSDAVWLAGLVVGVVFTLIAGYGFGSSPSGKFWAYAGLLTRAGLYMWAGDALPALGGLVLRRLLTVGLVAGMLELLVDWALIHWVPNGKLVYL